ncbi:hypothetical protein PGIGA_G00163240 [Pangasianodon gigas]|uniref:Uncharacterized protein n=1 Tax=Pangasianodon gigas TaxID=30993 RepID=A0ACC5XTP3_PANGG|nr:hypothetical protein [Pangasianodon gigas]
MGMSSSTSRCSPPTMEQPAFERPWREVNWSDGEQMLRKLKEFQSTQGVDGLRILVVGPIGAGKSSFITSVNTALQGRNTYLAHSLTGGFSPTLKYNIYKLKKDTDGSFFPFMFSDTMGLGEDSSGAYIDDLIRILQGQVQEGYTFNISGEPNAESNDFNATLSLNDRVHCLVFVLPADNISTMPGGIFDKMKLVLQRARELGIPQVIIMSKVDKGCSLVSEDLRRIYESKKIKAKMEECSCSLGIPMNYIFPVKNYHEEITTNAETDILILMAVTTIVDFANDFVKLNV